MKKSSDLTCDARMYEVGQVAVINGRRVKVTKAITTAISVVPYRWYQSIWDSCKLWWSLWGAE